MPRTSLTYSPYEPYRKRLALLADTSMFATLIDPMGVRQHWWAGNRDWVCTYSRFFPNESPYATLVFATQNGMQALLIVEAFDERPAPQTDPQLCFYSEVGGWLRLSRFPADSRLPTIGALLAEPGQTTVMRYRPGKRCTIRIQTEHNGTAFVKVFPDERGRPLYTEGKALWEAAQAGELGVAVAPMLRWDSATCALWQGQVPGRPILDRLFAATGASLAEQMGRAAASIARSSLQPQTTFSHADQLEDTAKQGAELVRRVPWLAGAVERLQTELAEIHNSVGLHPLAPIHGAPHAHQWLAHGEQLGLVDFDGFTRGDPELDIATFMSEIDFENPRKVGCVALNRAFLTGYEAIFGPVNRRLLTAYCAHKRLSKALKYAYALHPEGDRRAEAALGRALVTLLGGDF